MQPGRQKGRILERGTSSRRRNPAVAAVLRLAVAVALLGWGIARPMGGEAQTGSRWSPPTLLYDGMVSNHRTTLVSDRLGGAHVVWTPAEEDTYYYSHWDGSRWTTPIDIIVAPDGTKLQPPALVASADGRLHLFWACDLIMHSWAWSDEAAKSARAWSAPEAIVVPSGFAGGGMDAKEYLSGALHLVYAVGTLGVYYAHSDSDSLNWTEPAAVTLGGGEVRMGAPRLAVGPGGRIHAVWEEWPAEGDPAQSSEVYYAHSDDGRIWSEPQQLGGLADRGVNVLVGEDRTVYLGWGAGIASLNEGRIVQRSTDGGNSWEAPVTFSREKAQSGYVNMALDSEGTLHLISGEGSYAFWDGRSVSPASNLGPAYEQVEGARLAVVNGNQLLAVLGPFWSPGLYYTAKQLPLPTLPAAKLPTRIANPTIPEAATAEGATPAETSSTTAAEPTSRALPPAEAAPSTPPALVVSMGLSVALVAVVMIVQFGRRRR